MTTRSKSRSADLATARVRVTRLSDEITVLFDTANRDYAETLVEIGRRLTELQESLEYGDWLEWIEDTAPFGRSAAYNYIALAAWVDTHPADFHNWKNLGPSKLYAIATLDAAGLRALRRPKRHLIPGTRRRETLDRMSIPEVFRLVASLRNELPEQRAISRVMSGYRKRVRGLVSATAEVRSRRREIDEEQIRALHDELTRAAAQLARTFRLDE